MGWGPGGGGGGGGSTILKLVKVQYHFPLNYYMAACMTFKINIQLFRFIYHACICACSLHYARTPSILWANLTNFEAVPKLLRQDSLLIIAC